MMRFFSILAVFLMISSASWADDFFNPPPLNPELPPWMQDNSQPAQPSQPQPAQPAPDGMAPTTTEAVPFDPSGSEEEEGSPFDFEGGGGGGGGSGSDKGKDNFQILDKVERSRSGAECVGWGSSFLGTKVFNNESLCRAELDQELEHARDSINNYADHTEKEVLRNVIKGKVSREKSKDFHLQFDSLKGAISLAGKNGCKCLE